MQSMILDNGPTKCSIVWFVHPIFVSHNSLQRIRDELVLPSQAVVIFSESQECIDYLNRTHDEQLVLIISESNGEQIVRNVSSFAQIHSIFILCWNSSHSPSWVSICRSIRYRVVDVSSICEDIQIEPNQEHHRVTFDVLSASSSENDVTNRQGAAFMFGQLLKLALTKMSYTEDDMDKMIELFKEKSANSKASQKFRQHYTPGKALFYYTKEIFFYSCLNQALRTCDLDTIYTMGIFIRDLHNSLVQLHKSLENNDILRLFRGQVIPLRDFEHIQKNIGGLLSVNQFLSTSAERDVAEMLTIGAQSGNVGVLFCITIDQSASRTISYANIKQYSNFGDEDEYLFTMGSIFRIDAIGQLHSNNTWSVSLSLTENHDVQLNSLSTYYQKFLQSPDLSSLCLVMFLMGGYEKVIQICSTAVKTTKNILDLQTFYFMWGITCFYIGQKRQALEIIEQAFSYQDQWPRLRQLESTILGMKGLYSFMKQDYDLAVSFSQQCIDLEQQSPHPRCHYELLVICYQTIGTVKQEQGKFADALSFYSKASEVAQGNLPSFHPLITSNFQGLSICHFASGETHQSHSLIKTAEEIGDRSMLPADISTCQSNSIRKLIERKLENNQQALIHCSDGDQSELPENPMRLLQKANEYYLQEKYNEALSTIDQIIRLQKKTSPLLNRDMMTIYTQQGVCCLYKKDFTKALESFKQAEHLGAPMETKLGHKMSAIRLWIAVCYAEQNDDDQTMKIIENYRQTLSDRIEFHPSAFDLEPLNWLIQSFGRRAVNDQTHERYQKAVKHLERCLQLQRMIVPEKHLDQGQTYHMIGDCFRMMLSYSSALRNYRKGLAIYKMFLPSNDPAILQLCFLIGSIHGLADQYAEAIAAFMEHQRLLLTVHPPDYSALADNYQLVAEVYRNQGNLVDAVINYQQSLDIYVRHSLPVSFKTVGIWMYLGAIYASQREDEIALIAFNNALQILISMPTPIVSALADTHEQIALIHRRAKRYPEALSSLQNCLQNQMRFLSPDHLDLAETLATMGEINADLKCFSVAATCYEYALQIQIKYLPMTTSRMIITMQNAACCYVYSKDWENFFIMEEQILEFQLNILPANHLDIAKTYRQIGVVYHLIGEFEEALDPYLKCLDIQIALLPSDHPLLIETKAELDDICTAVNSLQ